MIITVAGEVDHETAPVVGSCLQHHLRRDGVDLVVVDMGSVAFCNAAGLRMLLDARRIAGEHHTQLQVHCAQESMVQRLMMLVGLDSLLPEEDATDV